MARRELQGRGRHTDSIRHIEDISAPTPAATRVGIIDRPGCKRVCGLYGIQSLTGPSDNMVPSDSRGFPAVPSKFLKYFGIGILYHHIAGCILCFVSVENL